MDKKLKKVKISKNFPAFSMKDYFYGTYKILKVDKNGKVKTYKKEGY